MHEVPHHLYLAAQVREFDRRAIEQFDIPGTTLMARAGAAGFTLLRQRWPEAGRVAVLCGIGNNGGDGYVVARLAHQKGMRVAVYQVGAETAVRGDARVALEQLVEAGLTPQPYDGHPLEGYEVVVDALLGTGLDREVEGVWAQAIERINQSGARVLALDIPSGLHADSGSVLGNAVVADVTLTFIGLKRGLYTGRGPDCCGLIRFDDLDIPAAVYDGAPPACLRFTYDTVAPLLVPRRRSAHKGDNGHVLVIGGDYGMAGAVRLAGEAAARVGAGLVSVATRSGHAAALSAARPELMVHGIDAAAGLAPLLARATVIAVGPGLGRSAWARTLLAQVLEAPQPKVIDADALNLLAAEPGPRDDWILTPHPGEAARLLRCATAEVQADRYAAAARLQAEYGGVSVLKGAGTVVCDADLAVSVCSDGNPGMASGGMGDVLTGVIAGLLGQGQSLSDAACLGVCMHARAGDRAAAVGGQRGMLASDLMTPLQHLANPVGP